MRSIQLIGSNFITSPPDRIDKDTFSYVHNNDGGPICGSCRFFNPDDSTCILFLELSVLIPDIFGMDINVSPYGNCKANRT